MYEIVAKKELAPTIVSIEVHALRIARKALPGHFVILMAHEKGERIPLTIADSDREKGTITLIFDMVGKTTKILGKLRIGDSISHLVGPLGNPFEVKKYGRIIGIGGGVGTGPLYPKLKVLREFGNYLISIIGAKTKELLILEEEIRKLSHETYVTTDDGSYGRKGFVTEVLSDLLGRGKIVDLVVAVGPVPMMKAVAEITRPFGIKTVVSLNPIMMDGTGMCGTCRVSVGGETKFTCVHGPHFDAHLVDFEELETRRSAYLDEEKIAMREYERCSGC